jgi:hypothetical protein
VYAYIFLGAKGEKVPAVRKKYSTSFFFPKDGAQTLGRKHESPGLILCGF